MDPALIQTPTLIPPLWPSYSLVNRFYLFITVALIEINVQATFYSFLRNMCVVTFSFGSADFLWALLWTNKLMSGNCPARYYCFIFFILGSFLAPFLGLSDLSVTNPFYITRRCWKVSFYWCYKHQDMTEAWAYIPPPFPPHFLHFFIMSWCNRDIILNMKKH